MQSNAATMVHTTPGLELGPAHTTSLPIPYQQHPDTAANMAFYLLAAVSGCCWYGVGKSRAMTMTAFAAAFCSP